jgi:hypothetical protein
VRAADLAPPPMTLDPLEPGSPAAGWPARLVIAIETAGAAPLVWDDTDPATFWDAGTPVLWDARTTGPGDFVDAFCDFQGMEIETGRPDRDFLFPAGRAVIQLDNRDGQWTAYDSNGRLTEVKIGRRVRIWALLEPDDTVIWLHAGYVAAWRDMGTTVEVESFDELATLALEAGPRTSGVNGDKPGPRITTVALAGGTPPAAVRVETGDVTLTAQTTTEAPLVDMQAVAMSDDGIVFGDADGAVVYFDRSWRVGRADQVMPYPQFTDNACNTGRIDVAAAAFTTDDETTVTRAALTNIAGTTAAYVDDDAEDVFGRIYPYAPPAPSQWTTAAEGLGVAEHITATRSQPFVAVTSFEVWLVDPRRAGQWGTVLDRRIGDRIVFTHDAGDVVWSNEFPLTAIAHAVTPEQWIVTMGTDRAAGILDVCAWNRGRWDVCTWQ